tara:strand:+ start:10428 stop:11147 length:720 start_codon:yes stop_codon:yes gene_type:complete
MGEENDKWLYRYTSLPSALDIIRHNRLTLLSPSTWSDGNDTGYLDAYRRAKGLSTLVALCFTRAFETSQHWHLFAPGDSGVRLRFERTSLEAAIANLPGAQISDVKYRKIDMSKINAESIEDWPFLKRYPYEGESETRIIYESVRANKQTFSIPIEPESLTAVALSPALPKALRSVLETTIRDASNDFELRITRSTMKENARWLNPVLERASELQIQRGFQIAKDRAAKVRRKREHPKN